MRWSPEVEALALEFIQGGGRFECEELSTGEASFTAVHEVEGEPADIAIEICPNGPEVPDAVEKLIHHAVAWLRATLSKHPTASRSAQNHVLL